MSMPVPVYTLSSNTYQETVDFLRRLSSMLTGGRNAEMLQQAANLIEALDQRAAYAEQRYNEQQGDHARNLELREVAELASDNLIAEVESLKAEIDLLKAQTGERGRQNDNLLSEIETFKARIDQLKMQLEERDRQSHTLLSEVEPLKDVIDQLRARLDERHHHVDNLLSEAEAFKAEIDRLQTQLAERDRRAEVDRNWFAEETLRAQAQAEQAQERLVAVTAELEGMRKPPPPEAIDQSIAVVPIQSLQVARTQFDYLAKGFASKGDVVSQIMCEIGVRALDTALANTPVSESGSSSPPAK